MKLIFTSLLFLLAILPSYAQTNTGVISGRISHNNNTPVEFATVTLIRVSDSVLVKGEISNDQGVYIIKDIPEGDYFLSISQIGFQKHSSETISIRQNQLDIEKNISLVEDSKVLQSVEVEAKKFLIEQQNDKLVMNLENTIIGTGMTATEILKRAPGVTLDKDGALNLKGKSGVMVMIDDKPMYLSGAQVGALLKSLPASQISSIEIITNPSAKYDAEGNAGIINIKLKKGSFDGFNGSFSINYGQGFFPKFTTGLALSYRKKGWRLSGNYEFAYRKNFEGFNSYRNFKENNQITSTFDQRAFYANPSQTHSFKINGDYSWKEKNTFSFNFSGLTYQALWLGGNTSNILDSNLAITDVYKTVDGSKDAWNNMDAGVGYIHTFDELGTELSFSADFNYFDQNNTQYFATDFYDNNGVVNNPRYELNSLVPTKVELQTYKIDFTKKFSEKTKIETGVKANFVTTDNNIKYFTPTGDLDSNSNYFVYRENILAAYISFSHELGKWSFQAGLRAEHTATEGKQLTKNETFVRDYTNWFPNASIGYKISEEQSLNLQYSSRIDRPDYQSLNPFAYFFDAFSYFEGNPFLLPQLTNNAEFSYSFFGGAVIAALNYTYTDQIMTDVYEQNAKTRTMVSTIRNINTFQNYGLSLAVNLPITKWWNSSNYFYIYNNVYKGNFVNQNFNNQLTAYTLTSTQTFTLPKKIELEVSGVYESPNISGINRSQAMYMFSLGLQKNIMKERATVKLNCTDVLWTYVWRDRANFANIDTNNLYRWDNRVLTFSFVYNFGNNIAKILGNDDSEEEEDTQKRGR